MSFSHAPAPSQTVPQGPAPYIHNWDATSIDKLPTQPPTHIGLPAKKPLTWENLKFNPLGCFDLRRRLGIFKHLPLLWNTYRQRFLASDLAWLAAGASDDNKHHLGARQTFHPQFDGLRDSVPQDNVGYMAWKAFSESIRKLIHDLATMWDRTFGSTMMIMHIEGATAPNTPARPEYLRTSVYIPPHFLRRNPDSHLAIAQIVQLYIESVGVQTVVDFTAGVRMRRWPQVDDAAPPQPNNIPRNIIVPAPMRAGSAHYVFRGRPAASVAEAAEMPPPTPPSSQGHEDPAASSAQIYLLKEEIALLNAKISDGEAAHAVQLDRFARLEQDLQQVAEERLSLLQDLERAQAAADEYSMQLEASLDREEGYTIQLAELQQCLDTLEGELTASRDTQAMTSRGPFSPPVYTASPPRTPTRPRAAAPFPSPTKIGDTPLPSTLAFLAEHNLNGHAATIQMMVRILPAAKWYKEIACMGLDDAQGELLLDCLTKDVLS
ncbi:hypothetical protein C8J57DRAFT_1491390 [Mycena rebaudengoi]|nr:hypothetical protein C8J57DRAFT_1491390 [Mycena rebaudengoi]